MKILKASLVFLCLGLGYSFSASACDQYFVTASPKADLTGFRIQFVDKSLNHHEFCNLDVVASEVDMDNQMIVINAESSGARCLSGAGHDFGSQTFEPIACGEFKVMINGSYEGSIRAHHSLVTWVD